MKGTDTGWGIADVAEVLLIVLWAAGAFVLSAIGMGLVVFVYGVVFGVFLGAAWTVAKAVLALFGAG